MCFYEDHSDCYVKGNPAVKGRKSHRPFSGPSWPLHKRWGWLEPRKGAREMEKKTIIIIATNNKNIF